MRYRDETKKHNFDTATFFHSLTRKSFSFHVTSIISERIDNLIFGSEKKIGQVDKQQLIPSIYSQQMLETR